jgi:hypothetical protein
MIDIFSSVICLSSPLERLKHHWKKVADDTKSTYVEYEPTIMVVVLTHTEDRLRIPLQRTGIFLS